MFHFNIIEKMGDMGAVSDYNNSSEKKITCRTKDIKCKILNPRYKKKKNFDNIVCHNNCDDDDNSLKTCCQAISYCSNDDNVCSSGWTKKVNSNDIECANNTCIQNVCCDQKEDTYDKIKNTILNTDTSSLNNAFNIGEKNHTSNNDVSDCKQSCSEGDPMPNCIGFTYNDEKKCTYFGVNNSYRNITGSDIQTDLYIQKSKKNLIKQK